MMDLGIARKVAAWSTLRKRGKPIEDNRVQDPEQNAQMESLDHRAYVGGLWEEIGRLQFEFLLRQGLAPSDCFLDIACGSLRWGVHFINYLDPGNYLGIEKQRRLVELGIEKVNVKQFVGPFPRSLSRPPQPGRTVCTDASYGGMVSRPPIPAPLWNTIPPEAQAAILALVASLEQRITDLETENADLRRQLAQVEHQLQNIRRRGRRTSHRCDEPHGPRTDRRRQEHRRHPGSFRPQPPPGTVFIEHDVRPQQCSHCGASDLEATGQFEDHVVADLPEPRLEWHRYRRHIYRCRSCQRTCQGRGELERPGAHIGQRARLLTCYSRAHVGISLGKTRDLLHDFFGLTISSCCADARIELARMSCATASMRASGRSE